MEKGEMNKCDSDKKNSVFLNLKKRSNDVVRLFGLTDEKPDFERINLSLEELNVSDDDNDEKRSKISESTNSVDYDIDCDIENNKA